MEKVSLETHSYDGKWSERLSKYSEKIKKIKQVNSDTRLSRLLRLETKLSDNSAKLALQLIMRDFGKPGNYDTINKVAAEDIMILMLDYMDSLKSEDYCDTLSELEEQLKDILLKGPCPQGRTTRIFQLFVSKIESDEDIQNTKN